MPIKHTFLSLLAGSTLALNAYAEGSAGGTANKDHWKIYSQVELFAFSEPVSVDQFATDFRDDLEGGDTALTHNRVELGVEYRGFRIGYAHRFDYVTGFTEDTALYHHSTKNGVALPQNRVYDLLLDVERVEAKGFEVGYEWNFHEGMTLDVSYSYYSELSQLQSGFASARGDLQPFTDQFLADAQVIIDGISAGNRDLSPLVTLAQNVQGQIAINYAYDEPKFGEETYRVPVVTGPQNPPISGVDFSKPSGTGYSVDIGFNWQVNDRLNVNLEMMDIANEFSWDNAPTTQTTLDLNAFILDALGVAQQLLDGAAVNPNDIIGRQVNVAIVNQQYKQELEARYDIEVNYDLDYQLSLFGWQPNLGVTGGYYKTDSHDFPRIGINLDRTFFIGYDIGGEALTLAYEGRYGFLKLVTDDFGYKDAHTIGFAAGLNYSF